MRQVTALVLLGVVAVFLWLSMTATAPPPQPHERSRCPGFVSYGTDKRPPTWRKGQPLNPCVRCGLAEDGHK